jgi:hypothetical protein
MDRLAEVRAPSSNPPIFAGMVFTVATSINAKILAPAGDAIAVWGFQRKVE